MGGEDSKLNLHRRRGEIALKISVFDEHSLRCGHRIVLDQQASRLGLTIEEFGARSEIDEPTPDCRPMQCLCQIGYDPSSQIATRITISSAGLCHALARNFKSNIGKGKKFVKPISFQGGVAANAGMRKAFLDVIGGFRGRTHRSGIILLPWGPLVPCWWLSKTQRAEGDGMGLSRLNPIPQRPSRRKGFIKTPLSFPSSSHPRGRSAFPPRIRGERRSKPILDWMSARSAPIWSSLTGEESPCKTLLMTAGRPIEAVRVGLQEIGEEIGDRVEIKGLERLAPAVTSRQILWEQILVRNEITAQATAAIYIDPKVDTIFEIGGQGTRSISASITGWSSILNE